MYRIDQKAEYGVRYLASELYRLSGLIVNMYAPDYLKRLLPQKIGSLGFKQHKYFGRWYYTRIK